MTWGTNMAQVARVNPTMPAQNIFMRPLETGLVAGSGALFFSADSYVGQKHYIKQGEDYVSDVFSKGIYKNKSDKIKQIYSEILKTKQVSKKLITKAAVEGGIIFLALFLTSKKVMEYFFNNSKKTAEPI